MFTFLKTLARLIADEWRIVPLSVLKSVAETGVHANALLSAIISDPDIADPQPLKVGDRVRCIKPYYDSTIPGELGTVVSINAVDPTIGVNWDRATEYRHGCSGKCPEGHGYYVNRDTVAPMWEPGLDLTPIGLYTAEYVSENPDEFDIEGDGDCGEDHEDLVQSGRDDVTGDPNAYGLYTESDLSDARSEGESEGGQYVRDNPEEFDLASLSNGYHFDSFSEMRDYVFDNDEDVISGPDISAAIDIYLRDGIEGIRKHYGYAHLAYLFPESVPVVASSAGRTVELAELAVVIPTGATPLPEVSPEPKAGDTIRVVRAGRLCAGYAETEAETVGQVGTVLGRYRNGERYPGNQFFLAVECPQYKLARSLNLGDGIVGKGFYAWSSGVEIVGPAVVASELRTLNLKASA